MARLMLASSSPGWEINPENYSLIGGVDEIQIGGPDDLMDRCQNFRQLGFVLHARNAVELGLQRRDAGLVDGVFIHAGRVIVAHLLLHRRPVRRRLAGLFQGVVHGGNVPQRQSVERAPASLVRRNGIGLDPFAAGVLEKVGAGVERLVHLIDAEALQIGRCTGGRGGGLSE